MALNIKGNILSSNDVTSVGVFKSKVNRDGLICHIDAGNKDSYSGSGTAITDLTGNGYNGTMNANCTWSSSYSGGAWIFNASNSWIDLPTVLTEISGLNPFSIEVWYQRTSTNTGVLFGNYGSGYVSGIWMFSGGIYIQGSCYEADYGASFNNIIYQLVCTRDVNGLIHIYRNCVITKNCQLSGSVPNNINYRIGADVNGGGEPFGGYIYINRVYNRELSPYEIAENFQATRGRFGI